MLDVRHKTVFGGGEIYEGSDASIDQQIHPLSRNARLAVAQILTSQQIRFNPQTVNEIVVPHGY